jgi:hypothetical protein
MLANIGEMPTRPKFQPTFQPPFWVVSIPPHLSSTGKRSRQYFRDKAEAFEVARKLRERERTFGYKLTNLNAKRMIDASKSFKLLEAHKIDSTLLSIVSAYITRLKEQSVSCSLSELFQAYLEIKPHLSAVWQQQMVTVWNRYRKIGDTLVSSITPQGIESIIEPLAPATKKRYFNILSTIFNYGIKKGYLKENPISKLDIPHIPKKSIRIFSNKVIEGMLRESLNSAPELLPYLILGSFCGLRSNSPALLHLTWKAIHWEELFNHYYLASSKEQAKQYWEIYP